MFLTFNAEIKEGKKITVSNNVASVNSSFLFVSELYTFIVVTILF